MLLKKKGNLLILERQGMKVPVYDNLETNAVLDIHNCDYDILDSGYITIYAHAKTKEIAKFLEKYTDIPYQNDGTIITIQIGERDAEQPEDNSLTIFDTEYRIDDDRVYAIAFDANLWTIKTASQHLKENANKLKRNCKVIKNRVLLFEQSDKKIFKKESFREVRLDSGVAIFLGIPKKQKLQKV